MKLTFKWDEKAREAVILGDDAQNIARELGSDEALAFLASCQKMIGLMQTSSIESRAKIDDIIIRRSPLGREGQPFV